MKQLTVYTLRWRRGPVYLLGGAVLCVGLYDQIPPRYPELQADAKDAQAQEQTLVKSIEAKLPKDAMIFQLPVYDFPEGPQVHLMRDYEHFRPYLHSTTLRFSYGAIKGRPRTQWQVEAEHAGPFQLIRGLEKFGFSAILINREGYEDRAAALVEALRRSGKSRVLGHAPDWICIALNPLKEPMSPTTFSENWYTLEPSGWRWSSGNAVVSLHHLRPGKRKVRLTFGLVAMNRRYLEISVGNKPLFEGVIDPGSPRDMRFDLTLSPGENKVQFATDRPGHHMPDGDTRRLAFSLIDFNVVERSDR